jgi:putative polyhydroxyalkanoate system protein
MPKFQVAVPHTLSQQDARKLLDRFIEEVIVKKFQDSVGDLEQHWEGDDLAFSFKTFGMQIAGKCTVSDNEVVVAGDLPFTAMMFKGKIESEIKRQLERLMSSGISKKPPE